MKTELTTKQERVLDYLASQISCGGKIPSLRQAAIDLGVSHAAVAHTIKVLEKKGYVKRNGHYSRDIYILNQSKEITGAQRWSEIPIIGRVTAGLPMYAQQEWDGSVIVDTAIYQGQNLFALHVKGDSMKNVGILNGDLAICEPCQYAQNGEIIVALINGEEATVKRFYLQKDNIELRPENPNYIVKTYAFNQILIQGKVVGIQRNLEDVKYAKE